MACTLRSGLQLGVSSVMSHNCVRHRNAVTRTVPRTHLNVQCAKGFAKKKSAPKKTAGAKPSSTKQVSKPKQTATKVRQPAVEEEAPRPARRQLPVAPNPSPDTNRPESAISLPSSVPDLVDAYIELDDKEFADRLTALKAAGKLKAKEKAAQANPEAQSAMGNILESEPSIYSNPPPLSQTILKEMNSGISDPSMQTQTFGPSQIGIAAGAIALVGVLVFTSVGGFSSSSRYKGVRPSKPPPNEIQATILSNQVESSKEALRENPKDEAALEALGYAYSDLYEFGSASDAFEQLVALPNRKEDLTAWKLFGESSLLAERPQKAVQGFETAWNLQDNDFNILTNLTNAYIANGDFPRAVDRLKGVQDRLQSGAAATATVSTTPVVPTTEAAPAATPGTPSSSQPEVPASEVAAVANDVAAVADATAVASEAVGDVVPAAAGGAVGNGGMEDAAEVAEAIATTSRDAGKEDQGSGRESSSAEGASALSELPASLSAPPVEASSASDATTSEVPESQLREVVSRKAKRLDPIGVDLLLAKVYSAWRGHDIDATATYDTMIKAYPEDFRGYLAKGVFLRDRGRGVEAKKMFLQARYYTPPSQQAMIDRISKNEDLKTGS